MIHEQARISELMQDLLGKDLFHLSVVSYDLHEDFERETCRIACTIRYPDGKNTVIEGLGVGAIDAFFNGLLGHLSREYPSLQTIVIDRFLIANKAVSGSRKSGSDALAAVTVGIKNSRGTAFEFVSESRSITRSGIDATLRAAEYFVNSELAFKRAYHALVDARERRRQDVVAKYTDLMAQLVKNTSYSEVIEQIRADVEGQRG